ncbi:MAG: hypothetical protein HQL37_15275 [Alphaproteobacteria bacterium]|nr:hypothetical protein [Alphaproteobacteria bacterium]
MSTAPAPVEAVLSTRNAFTSPEPWATTDDDDAAVAEVAAAWAAFGELPRSFQDIEAES